jgi:hypothetical protein
MEHLAIKVERSDIGLHGHLVFFAPSSFKIYIIGKSTAVGHLITVKRSSLFASCWVS